MTCLSAALGTVGFKKLLSLPAFPLWQSWQAHSYLQKYDFLVATGSYREGKAITSRLDLPAELPGLVRGQVVSGLWVTLILASTSCCGSSRMEHRTVSSPDWLASRSAASGASRSRPVTTLWRSEPWVSVARGGDVGMAVVCKAASRCRNHFGLAEKN